MTALFARANGAEEVDIPLAQITFVDFIQFDIRLVSSVVGDLSKRSGLKTESY